MAAAILAEASLSFLGLGIQPPTASWGAMINAGRSHLLDAPHLTLFPGLAILLTVMGLNFSATGWSMLSIRTAAAEAGRSRRPRSSDVDASAVELASR